MPLTEKELDDLDWANQGLLSALGYIEVELRDAQNPNATAQQIATSFEYYIPKRIKNVIRMLKRVIAGVQSASPTAAPSAPAVPQGKCNYPGRHAPGCDCGSVY